MTATSCASSCPCSPRRGPDPAESHQITLDRVGSRIFAPPRAHAHRSAARSHQIAPDHVGSRQIAPGRVGSRQIASYRLAPHTITSHGVGLYRSAYRYDQIGSDSVMCIVFTQARGRVGSRRSVSDRIGFLSDRFVIDLVVACRAGSGAAARGWKFRPGLPFPDCQKPKA